MVPGRARSPTRTASCRARSGSRRKLTVRSLLRNPPRKRLTYRVGHLGQFPIVDYLSRNARMRGGRIARAGRLGKFKRVWDPFPSRSPNLAAFFPAGPPNFGRRKVLRMRRFRSALRRLLGGGAADVAASLASRATAARTSACASRSTSGHFIVTLRYVVQSLPMTMRDFLQSTLPPSLKGISTGSLSPGRTPRSGMVPCFHAWLNELLRIGFSDKVCRVRDKNPLVLCHSREPSRAPVWDAGKRAGCSRLSAGRPIPAFG